MRILQTVVTGPEPCPYLDEELWIMKFAQIGRMTPGEYDARLREGWFKYGHYLQRPVCEHCQKCLSLRVPLAEFAHTRAMRRNLERNRDLTVTSAIPAVCDGQRVRLHNRYRNAQAAERGWRPALWSEEGYALEFVHGPMPMLELAAWEGERLVALALCDLGRNALAGVTHYWEPTMRERGLGLFIMLQVFEAARRLEKKWVYMGYWVDKSPTMDYKRRFRPAEVRGWDGSWKRL